MATDYTEAPKQAQINQLAQIIEQLGWRLLDPTLPTEVSQYAIDRLTSLLEYASLAAKAREQG